jgi:1-deoxy-D-xylulose-5-phosphate reductoisomerase
MTDIIAPKLNGSAVLHNDENSRYLAPADECMRNSASRRVAIFGATGSIGTTALDIIEANPDRFVPVLLSCNTRVDKLLDVLARLDAAGRLDNVEAVCVRNDAAAATVLSVFPGKRKAIYIGANGLAKAARKLDYDVMLNAIVGIAGLAPTLAAIENGARRNRVITTDLNAKPHFEIALANKETLVAGGRLVMKAAAEAGVSIIPVDSEHSAVFQCLAGNRCNVPRRVIITASGGPFLGMQRAELENVTPEQALTHPNWSMGAKITIDSATMLNKAFELIEAKWLFDLPMDGIEAIIHPGSIVHSFVEFRDGALLAQLGVPSMKAPISYALSYPYRFVTDAGFVDLTKIGSFEFMEPSGEGARAIKLAKRIMRELENGDDVGSITINGANEVLVAAFLEGKIKFTDVLDGVEYACDEMKTLSRYLHDSCVPTGFIDSANYVSIDSIDGTSALAADSIGSAISVSTDFVDSIIPAPIDSLDSIMEVDAEARGLAERFISKCL